MRTAERWLYEAVLLDLWRRLGVGWATAATLPARLATSAVRIAIQPRRPPKGLLPHSDRGGQYASSEDRGWLTAAGLEASLSRTGNPYENAAMESFNATDKREGVGLAEARVVTPLAQKLHMNFSTTSKNITTGCAATAPSATKPRWTSRPNSTKTNPCASPLQAAHQTGLGQVMDDDPIFGTLWRIVNEAIGTIESFRVLAHVEFAASFIILQQCFFIL